jgi:hypothetical protein
LSLLLLRCLCEKPRVREANTLPPLAWRQTPSDREKPKFRIAGRTGLSRWRLITDLPVAATLDLNFTHLASRHSRKIHSPERKNDYEEKR